MVWILLAAGGVAIWRVSLWLYVAVMGWLRDRREHNALYDNAQKALEAAENAMEAARQARDSDGFKKASEAAQAARNAKSSLCKQRQGEWW